MKTIEFNPLSKKSVLHAKREVLKYKRDFEVKFEKFNKELKLRGLELLRYRVSDTIATVDVEGITCDAELTQSGKNSCKIVIKFGGKDAVFLEFGTGITFNGSKGSSPHPKGAEMGMLIGEYGFKQGSNPKGWWYTENGQRYHTLGIPMKAPLYYSFKDLKEEVESIARKVWG